MYFTISDREVRMKKKKKDEDQLEKLVKLTKLMKMENVRVAPKGPARPTNKWRSQDPKFAPKTEKPKPEGLVEAGGMQVDPTLAQEYENWRKDKIAEQEERRIQTQRKWESIRKAKAALRKAEENAPPSDAA
jgi:hypothetical protein